MVTKKDWTFRQANQHMEAIIRAAEDLYGLTHHGTLPIRLDRILNHLDPVRGYMRKQGYKCGKCGEYVPYKSYHHCSIIKQEPE